MIKALLRKDVVCKIDVGILESNISEFDNQEDKETSSPNRFKKAQTHAPRIMNKDPRRD